MRTDTCHEECLFRKYNYIGKFWELEQLKLSLSLLSFPVVVVWSVKKIWINNHNKLDVSWNEESAIIWFLFNFDSSSSTERQTLPALCLVLNFKWAHTHSTHSRGKWCLRKKLNLPHYKLKRAAAEEMHMPKSKWSFCSMKFKIFILYTHSFAILRVTAGSETQKL